MTYLAAIILMAFALVFYGFHLAHGVWTWEFFMLFSFLLAMISRHPKYPY